MLNVLSLIIAYLIGSLSFAILAAKYFKLPDPRTAGSGNAGATNILRLAGRKQAVLVLMMDYLKGVVAVLLARYLGTQGTVLALAVLLVVTGHVFPVFHHFKGGKGVATSAGALLALSGWVGLSVAAIWITMAFCFRYASLASLTAIMAAPILVPLLSNPQYTLPVLLTAALIAWKHWDNINRLYHGTETKITFRRHPPKS